MKNSKTLLGLVFVLGTFIAGTGCSGNSNARAAGFSNANVSGPYAFSLSGYFVLLPPVVSTPTPTWLVGVGQLTADGKGHLTGSESFSLLGTQCAGTLTGGVYSINADGTGTLSATYAPTSGDCAGEAVGLSLVLTNGGAGLKFYSTSPQAVTFGEAAQQ
jgi:hypothetical protein